MKAYTSKIVSYFIVRHLNKMIIVIAESFGLYSLLQHSDSTHPSTSVN